MSKRIATEIVVLFFGVLMNPACVSVNDGDCDADTIDFDNEKYNFIIDNVDIHGRNINLIGHSPVNGKKAEIDKSDGWYTYLDGKYQIGDTVEKVKNRNWFLIKKKGYNLKVSYICSDSSFIPPMIISEAKSF